MKHFREVVASIFLLWAFSACAFSGNVIEGQVLEVGTNKPLAGAIVIARWDKTYSSLVDTTTVCIHVESAVTDEQGRFRLPTWRGKAPSWGTDVHKPGYERSSEHHGTRTGEYDYVLKPHAGTREERLKYLLKINRTTGCNSASESEKNLFPLRKAVYEEAEQLTKTSEDRKTLEDLLYSKEIIELGYEAAQKRHLKRLETQK